MKIQVVGLNSSEVADSVREGELEAGIVQLPVDDHGLSVSRPVLTDEVVYVSADPERVAEPVTIEQLATRPLILSEARWSNSDPLRLSLTARAQQAGVSIAPHRRGRVPDPRRRARRPRAWETRWSRSSSARRMIRGSPASAGFPSTPPVEEHFAFITREKGALSPATRAFMALAADHVATIRQRR